jgi:hypothetical protein
MKKLTVVLTILTLLVAGTTAASAQKVAQLYGSGRLTSQNTVTAIFDGHGRSQPCFRRRGKFCRR